MHNVTVLIIGGEKVGKKSLLSRFLFQDPEHREESYQTFYPEEALLTSKEEALLTSSFEVLNVKFVIADRIEEGDLEKIEGVVLLFSLQDPSSLSRIYAPLLAIKKQKPSLPLLILGNKADVGYFIDPFVDYLPLSTWLDYNVSSLYGLLEKIKERAFPPLLKLKVLILGDNEVEKRNLAEELFQLFRVESKGKVFLLKFLPSFRPEDGQQGAFLLFNPARMTTFLSIYFSSPKSNPSLPLFFLGRQVEEEVKRNLAGRKYIHYKISTNDGRNTKSMVEEYLSFLYTDPNLTVV